MTTTVVPVRKRRQAGLGYRLLANQEILLVGLIVLIVVAVCIKEPSFFSVQTLFNVLTSSMVSIVFALGVMLVIISGGIDVSFLAIGIFAAYLTCKIGPQGGGAWMAIVPFLMAIAIGVVLGLVNAAVVISARVSVLIATLATSSIFMGVLFAYVGGDVISTLPTALQALGQEKLITRPGQVRGVTSLSVLILVMIAVCVLMWAFLKYTVAGRRVFAIGGDAEAASRAAISVPRTRVLVFVIAGALAGLAGVMSITLSGRADPTVFMGGELDVLAAVVLGGAAITGGRGSVRGVVLGVLLISLIETSLVPLGIPTIWQKATVGALLLVGVGLQAVIARRRPARPILETTEGAPA